MLLCMLHMIMGLRILLHKLDSFVWRHICEAVRTRIGSTKIPTLDDIEILLETDNYVVVNKSCDVLINSDDPKDTLTLQHQLARLRPELVNKKLKHWFYFTHRLDYATSGVMCISKNKRACAAAGKAFEKRHTTKYYLAIVRGHVSQEFLSIEYPIGKDGREEYSPLNLLMCTGDKKYCLDARHARTLLLILQRGIFSGHPATKVLLKPETGRRHQLRLHCSEAGHTLVGDYAYSKRRDVLPPRMLLHAHRLRLPTALETLDVATNDPFVETFLPQWHPVETLNRLEDEAYAKMETTPVMRIPPRNNM